METINIAASLGATTSKSSKRETLHQSKHHVTKESAPLLWIIMNLMCEWVKYFNINLYFPTYAYSPLGNNSRMWNICILFTSLPTLLFVLLSLFSFHSLKPASVEWWCDLQCFSYHCVPRKDMFHPPGPVAVPDQYQSVSWLNNRARGWEKVSEWGAFLSLFLNRNEHM